MRKIIKDVVVSLRMTTEMYDVLESIAETRRCDKADVLRACIRFGLLAFRGEPTDIRVMVKDGDEWKPVMLI